MNPRFPLMELTDADVICGRGRRGYTHEGNIRFREIVLNASVQYACEGRNGKSTIVSSILNEVHATGGRFILFDSWEQRRELTRSEQKEKVRHAVRDAMHYLQRKWKVVREHRL